MTNPSLDEEKPLDPAAARIVAKVRWLMVISGLTTLVGIFAVLGVIGYRVFRAEGSARGYRRIHRAFCRRERGSCRRRWPNDRIVVSVEIAGTLEIRTFDAVTLKPTGQLRFATEP